MAHQEHLTPRRNSAFLAMDAQMPAAHRRSSTAWTSPLDAENGRLWTSRGRPDEIACQAMDADGGRPWTAVMDAPHSLRGVHPSPDEPPVLTMAHKRIQQRSFRKDR